MFWDPEYIFEIHHDGYGPSPRFILYFTAFVNDFVRSSGLAVLPDTAGNK